MNFIKEKIIMSTTKTKLKFVRFLFLFNKVIRSLFGLPMENIFIKRKGLSWEVDLNEAIDFCLYFAGEYEPELIDSYRPIINHKNMTIIDIGANIGAHTLNFANLTASQSKIYAIEPTEFAMEKLKRNISSSWNIEEDITSEARNSFDGGFAKSTTNAKAMTLDEFVLSQGIEQLDLIKLDVDGNEVDILKGSQNTFKRLKPILLVELSPIHFDNKEQPYSFSDQVEELQKLNYEFHDVLGKKIEMNTKKLENWIPKGTLINIIGYPKMTKK